MLRRSMDRRISLLLALLLCKTAMVPVAEARRDRDVPETEMLVGVQDAQTSGHWTCGPSVHTRSVGARLGLRHSERERFHEHGRGASVLVRAAADTNHETIVLQDQGSFAPSASYWTGAGSLRFGYEGRWLGGEIGGAGWFLSGAEPRHASVFFLPELEFKVGPAQIFQGTIGFGAPSLAFLNSMGPYVGLEAGLPRNIHLQARFGAYTAPYPTAGWRGDLEWTVPVTSKLDLSANLALGWDKSAFVDRQAGLGLSFRP